jgi:mannose-1-phosphate guanylyltransferase
MMRIRTKDSTMSTTRYRAPRCGVVLAGGDGKRLRAFERRLLGFELPKQYVSFTGNRSMLKHTFHRAEQLISRECLYAVVAQDHFRHPEVVLRSTFLKIGVCEARGMITAGI